LAGYLAAKAATIAAKPTRIARIRKGTADEFRLTEVWSSSGKSVLTFDVHGTVAKSTYAGIRWLRRIKQAVGDLSQFLAIRRLGCCAWEEATAMRHRKTKPSGVEKPQQAVSCRKPPRSGATLATLVHGSLITASRRQELRIGAAEGVAEKVEGLHGTLLAAP
jgi:hypothetical protein